MPGARKALALRNTAQGAFAVSDRKRYSRGSARSRDEVMAAKYAASVLKETKLLALASKLRDS